MHLLNVYINIECIVKSANSYKYLLCFQLNHSIKCKCGVHVVRINQCRQVRTSVTDVRTSKKRNGRPTTRWADTFNPLTPNDPYRGHTAPLTSKRYILYIYSTNIGTEYFKHGMYSTFFSLQNAVFFHNSNVFVSCIIHILYTGCAKIKKIIPTPKG